MITISSNFDSGNIICHAADDPAAIRLSIARDHQSDFYQWFHYRLAGAKGTGCTMTIENAAGAAYVQGWPDYQACASYDRDHWFRVPTAYQDGKLIIRHTPAHDSIWYAYFAPYPMDRHHDLVADAQLHEEVSLKVLGQTLDGQDMDLLVIGSADGEKRRMWITARQHPGETMAEWWIEGFLARLLDDDDPVANALRRKALFYVIPNMNPDGSRRGHLRTNAAGINLNREWDRASLEKSPEVFHVLTEMNKTGVDFALDVHGDEALPYNFIAGGEGAPSFTPQQQALQDRYCTALKTASPDFQTEHGYPVTPAGKANLSICTNYMAETFGCLAMTLEMPFKDTADTPMPETGWSPERCRKLGAASLDAMLAVVDELR